MKASEYPEGTVIELKDGSEYQKSETHWLAVNGHCVDCMDDDNYTIAAMDDMTDEGGFKVLSVPFKYTLALVNDLADAYSGRHITNPFTLNLLFREVIEEVDNE